MLFLQREFEQNVYIYRWPLTCMNETGCLETGNNLTGHHKMISLMISLILLPPETKLNSVFSVQMITALEAIE